MQTLGCFLETDDRRMKSFLFKAQAVYFGRISFAVLYFFYLALLAFARNLAFSDITLDLLCVWLLIMGSALSFRLRKNTFGREIHFITLLLDISFHLIILRHQQYLLSPMMAMHPFLTATYLLLFQKPRLFFIPLLTLPIATLLTCFFTPNFSSFELIVRILIFGILDVVVIFFVHQAQSKEIHYLNSLVSLEQQLKKFAISHERERLAREFHDGVGSKLTSIAMLCEMPPEKHGFCLLEIRKIALDSIDDMRRSIAFLNNEFDIIEQIEIMARNFTERHGLAIELGALDAIKNIPLKSQLSLCRIVQEALTNIVKHAKARNIKIESNSVNGEIRCIVNDDGQGFLLSTSIKNHYGLRNMADRAQQEGAQFVLNSTPGQGTHVEIRFLR